MYTFWNSHDYRTLKTLLQFKIDLNETEFEETLTNIPLTRKKLFSFNITEAFRKLFQEFLQESFKCKVRNNS